MAAYNLSSFGVCGISAACFGQYGCGMMVEGLAYRWKNRERDSSRRWTVVLSCFVVSLWAMEVRVCRQDWLEAYNYGSITMEAP
jgi:hypothetical protein